MKPGVLTGVILVSPCRICRTASKFMSFSFRILWQSRRTKQHLGTGSKCLVAFLAVVSLSPLRAASSWRFWTKADGLAESWTFGLSRDRSGRVVVKHGD